MAKKLPTTKQPDPGELPSEVLAESEPLPAEKVEEVSALPNEGIENKPAPPVGNTENLFTCDGVTIEIKPTRLYYQRNGVAGFYRALKSMPLPYIFQLPDDFFDAKRTPTKCLMDWVTCVVDNPEFTKKHFDNMTSQDIYTLLEMFCRLNSIDEMEEQVKNRAATATMG